MFVGWGDILCGLTQKFHVYANMNDDVIKNLTNPIFQYYLFLT